MKSSKSDEVRVDIETILAAQKIISDFNKLDLENVLLYKKGKLIRKHHLEEFKNTGLANKDYILTGFYKKNYGGNKSPVILVWAKLKE